MFKKVLIANRGEIAVRAIRACREMGIETVSVYSKADVESLHVKYADKAVCIGDGKASSSYLYTYRIFSVAETLNCDAIYPGTGFFSENAVFAELCEKYGVHFIGAESNRLRILTSKILAKQAAVDAGIPVVRSSGREIPDSEACKKEAELIGYPVILKAVDGGGGKGIRIVTEPKELESAFESCREEAKRYFKSDKIFIEQYVTDTRHVEVQILADELGNVIHLFDRDCTMQRRNQKLIEEATSRFIPDGVKEKMYADAVRLIRHIGYTGAATVEFLVDPKMNYYFMEVNPRVQVEHPVTEEITGADIVQEQMRIAAGETLHIKQPMNKPQKHAIECRINAEDISSNFMCSTGVISKCTFPRGKGIRIESHIQPGFAVTPYYDSLIAKIIVTADTREEAVVRMKIALHETIIEGVRTNIGLQLALLDSEGFLSGNSTTHYVTDFLKNWDGK